MAPQEEEPQHPYSTRRFKDDPSSLEAQLLPQPTLPPPLILNSGLPSPDRLPTVEPRRVEVEWEGGLPSIEDLWAGKSDG